MKLLAVIALALSLSTLACTEDGRGGFLPENDLSIPIGKKTMGGITQAQFNSVIDRLGSIYVPIASSVGANLKIVGKWEDGTVNARANRVGAWHVNMFGGLARHPAITEDGFALVLCHEIGHHLGGAPKVSGFFRFNRWASNEGQSDYFATMKCLRRYFLNDNNSLIVKKLNPPKILVSRCASAFPGEGSKADQDICIRSGMAGVSVAGLFAALRSQPQGSFDTPDRKIVSKTDDSHPGHQCRLDTFFQGALCEKSFNEDVSQNDEVQGTCHASTGHTVGLRPLCWFKPKK